MRSSRAVLGWPVFEPLGLPQVAQAVVYVKCAPLILTRLKATILEVCSELQGGSPISSSKCERVDGTPFKLPVDYSVACTWVQKPRFTVVFAHKGIFCGTQWAESVKKGRCGIVLQLSCHDVLFC